MVPAERLARGLKEGAERRRCRTRNRCRRKRQGIRGGRGGGGGVIVGGKGRGGGGGGVVVVAKEAGVERKMWCVCVCVCVCRTRLCNPFRESAERGTQTPEWGKNSVSSPLPSTLFLCLQRSGFPALPYTPVSHGSRLRGNQAKHKLGRRIVAGNIYKP